jgi:DNA-directed RNA polymerase specialized sigma subunit
VPVSGAGDDGDDDRPDYEFADTRATPEQDVLRREAELEASDFVDNFLKNLEKSVRGKAKQFDRMLSVLWHCYLISDSGTQLEVAEMLGVSDSLVSDYRKRIESNLQQLTFNGVNEARHFEKALKQKVRRIISHAKEEVTA